MAKNIILGFSLGALAVVIALVVAGKLTWKEPEKRDVGFSESRQEALRNANEMAKPTVLQIGDQQVLSIPDIDIRGNDIHVKHTLAIIEEGGLRKLDFIKQKNK